MCDYRFHNGDTCPHPGQPLCFWHDPHSDKSADDIAAQLEQLISEGHSLEGFQLAHSNLAGIHLLLAGQNLGVCMRNADLYRANLQGAHMFRADLRGGSLMKADCREANLNFSDLRDTNLLGTRIEGARIDNIQWGVQLRQQKQACAALKARQADKAADAFEQAEEICRGLRKVSEQQGLFELAGRYFLWLRRKTTARYSVFAADDYGAGAVLFPAWHPRWRSAGDAGHERQPQQQFAELSDFVVFQHRHLYHAGLWRSGTCGPKSDFRRDGSLYGQLYTGSVCGGVCEENDALTLVST